MQLEPNPKAAQEIEEFEKNFNTEVEVRFGPNFNTAVVKVRARRGKAKYGFTTTLNTEEPVGFHLQMGLGFALCQPAIGENQPYHEYIH